MIVWADGIGVGAPQAACEACKGDGSPWQCEMCVQVEGVCVAVDPPGHRSWRETCDCQIVGYGDGGPETRWVGAWD